MSEYLVLIYESEASYSEADEQVYQEVLVAHNAFRAKHGPALRDGNALHDSGTATSIRRSSTAPVLTDGQFVETKEVLGGYYLIEAADLDEAVTIATDVPARFGGVEVRPIMTLD